MPTLGIARAPGDFSERFFGFSPDNIAMCNDVIRIVVRFVVTNGPFDGLVAFSEGASVAAGLIIEDSQRSTPMFQFKCAIFFCGLAPVDMELTAQVGGRVRHLSKEVDSTVLRLPTAHVWSLEGDHGDMGRALQELCEESLREEFVHDLGHDIPGSRSDEGLTETLRVIERTIERATYFITS